MQAICRLLQVAGIPCSACYMPACGASCRARSKRREDYSGYKHHRLHKLQVLCGDHGRIVGVSKSYPGSVHDHRIRNAEWCALQPLLKTTVFGDKTCAGAAGEGSVLQRPVKRNERRFKETPCAARIWNCMISTLRVRIEHVFARLKSFAILARTFALYWSRLACVVGALAVIYNTILEEKCEASM